MIACLRFSFSIAETENIKFIVITIIIRSSCSCLEKLGNNNKRK
jgi:hypothetical protein